MNTKKDGRSALLTCGAQSEGVLVEELRRMGLPGLPGKWLDTGDAVQGSILLVDTGEEFDRFSERVERFGSIFIRHMAPVEYVVELQGSESDLETICALVPNLSASIEHGLSFSVQSRILGEGKLPYRKVALNERISQALEESMGVVMDCRWPQQVVSILCTPSTAYIGVSRTHENRSAWPGGKHRFKRDEEQVSRGAEFKLLEAMSVFGFELPTQGRALDIGASPGGWTRLLAAQGLKVDAVDPGDLDPRIRSNRLVTHVRKRIQNYSPGSKMFDVIVNDMKMDARDSIDIMLSFARNLAPDGIAAMTLKMPKVGASASVSRKALDMVLFDLDRLSSGYEVVGARQLYHNRSEVTVAMRAAR